MGGGRADDGEAGETVPCWRIKRDGRGGRGAEEVVLRVQKVVEAREGDRE